MARGRLTVTISTPHRDGGWFRKAMDAQKGRIGAAVKEALERVAEEVWNMPETPRQESHRLANEAGEMMQVHAITGMDLDYVFREWATRAAGITVAALLDGTCCGGLGPPWLMQSESPEDFGRRFARGVLQLLKEA